MIWSPRRSASLSLSLEKGRSWPNLKIFPRNSSPAKERIPVGSMSVNTCLINEEGRKIRYIKMY